jgi:hypothetical protein
VTPPLLMPDTAEARFLGLTDDYAAWRRWWARNVLKLKVKKSREPDPGALPLADDEDG